MVPCGTLSYLIRRRHKEHYPGCAHSSPFRLWEYQFLKWSRLFSSMNITSLAWNQRLDQWNSAIVSHSRSASSGRLDDFTYDNILMLLYLLTCQASESETLWRASEMEKTVERSGNKSIDTLLGTAVLICARIESSALEWCEINLTPIWVEFENWVLPLAFKNVVEQYIRGQLQILFGQCMVVDYVSCAGDTSSRVT